MDLLRLQEHRDAIVENLLHLVPVDPVIRGLLNRALATTEEDIEVVAAAKAALDAVMAERHDDEIPF